MENLRPTAYGWDRRFLESLGDWLHVIVEGRARREMHIVQKSVRKYLVSCDHFQKIECFRGNLTEK